MTSTATVFVADSIPSVTTSRMECVPTGKTGRETARLPRRLSSSYQRYCRTSPSGSEERLLSRRTVAFVLFGEMTNATVALASATGH